MATYAGTPGDRSSPPPVQPPPKVVSVATGLRLGMPLATRRGSNPVGNLVTALVAAVILFGLTIGLGVLVEWVGVLRYLALLTCALGVGAVVMGLIALAAGFTSVFLYEHGLVRVKNGRPTGLTWPDIRELRILQGSQAGLLAGKVLAYEVFAINGRKLPIEADTKSDRDQIGEHVRMMVERLGRPVVLADARGRPLPPAA